MTPTPNRLGPVALFVGLAWTAAVAGFIWWGWDSGQALLREHVRQALAGHQPAGATVALGDAIHSLQVHWALMLGGAGLVGLAGLGVGAASMRGRMVERERVLAELRDSELKYRTLADRTSTWEFWVGPDGRWIHCSSACARIAGKEAEAFLQDPGLFASLITPEDRGLWATHLRACDVPGTGDGQLEFRIVAASGETRWIEHTCSRVRAADGRELGRRGTNRDVTDRKRAERLLILQRDLAASLATAATLQEALHSAVSVAIAASGLDSGGLYLAAADGSLDLACHMGLPEAFVEHARHYGPETPNAILVASGVSRYFDLRDLQATSLPRQSSLGLTALAVVPIRHQGRLVGCLNVASHEHTSVPEWSRVAIETIAAQIAPVILREQDVVALHDSEESLRAFFDSISDFLFVLDEGGAIVRTNNAVVDRLGYSEEELRGQSVLFVHPAPRRQEAADIVREMLAGNRAFCPVPLQAKDGHLVPVETVVTQGSWRGRPALFGVSRDVGEREQAAEELRQRNEELARFNRAAVGRELRMIELKQEVNDLCRALGRAPRYRNAGAAPDAASPDAREDVEEPRG